VTTDAELIVYSVQPKTYKKLS